MAKWLKDTAIRNACLQDHLLDWFENVSGEHVRDTDLPDFDLDLEMTTYLAEKTRIFLMKVLDHAIDTLNRASGGRGYCSVTTGARLDTPVVEICQSRKSVEWPSKAEETIRAVQAGVPIILNATLHDSHRRVMCSPQLLVREDVLHTLVSSFQTLDKYYEDEKEKGPALPMPSPLPSASARTRKKARADESKSVPVDPGRPPIVNCRPGFHRMPSAALPAAATVPAAARYVIVSVRFRTLSLSKKWPPELDNTGQSNAYERSLFHLQNVALATIQDGWHPNEAYVLGRGWKCGTKRNGNALHTLGVVDCRPLPMAKETKVSGMSSGESGESDGGGMTLSDIRRDHRAHAVKDFLRIADRACAWMRKVHTDGHLWNVLPVPTHRYLYPNMKNKTDFPWSAAKANLARQLKEITCVWKCGLRSRVAALSSSSLTPSAARFDNPLVTPELLGIRGAKTSKLLDRVLQVNRSDEKGLLSPSIIPEVLTNAKGDWSLDPKVFELFVDFEFGTDLSDTLETFPFRQDRSIVAMIGCGYWDKEAKDWKYAEFICDPPCRTEEARIIDAWLMHMDKLVAHHNVDHDGPRGEATTTTTPAAAAAARAPRRPRVWHWSQAEPVVLERAYNSAQVRHKRPDWQNRVEWMDLYRLFLDEGIAIRGCLGYGLKAVSKALYNLGKIDKVWPVAQVDNGLSAMVALFRCQEMALRRGTSVMEMPYMQQLRPYLRIDVRALHSVLHYFRSKHLKG